MIVNLKNSEKLPWLANLFRVSLVMANRWGLVLEQKKILKDLPSLKKYFFNYYPKLKHDSLDNSICISCGLCEDICPTLAISIKKPNMVNFPDSLQTGEAPSNFYLDTNSCTKCKLCAITCPVDALELTAKYTNIRKVDLAKKHPN